MASISREKIDSINRKCWNGWELDVEYYIYHNQRTLVKQIQLDSQNFLQFKLEYNSLNQITLHISKYFQESKDKFAVTSGLGKNKVLSETQEVKKNINKLINLTEKLNNAKLLEINKNTQVDRSSSMFEASEDF